MVYQVFKWLFYLTIKAYFKTIYIKGTHHIPQSGPVIFVANHNSAFMDPILLGVHVKRPLYFLARGESFKSKLIAWIFKRFHMIPVYRPEVTPEKVYKNKAVFQRCFEHLKAKKALIIFPEGFSKTERRLRKIKTGAARIALGAEDQNNFQLGVKIVPIGINYSNPHYFRSHVFINIGAAINVSDFKEEYHKDDKQGVVNLTEKIKKSLEELLVIVKNERLDRLTAQIEMLYKDQFNDSKSIDNNAIKKFTLSQEIVNGLALRLKTRPKELFMFQTKLNSYFRRLNQLKLRDEYLGNLKIRVDLWSNLLYFIFGLPIFLFGFISNIIPYKVAELLAKKIIVRKDFVGSMKIAFGMFVFLIFYIVLTILFAQYIHKIYALVFLCALYPTGLFALNYIKNFYLFREKIRYFQLNTRKNKPLAKLRRRRKELINEVDHVRKLYLQSLESKGY